jgi:hypothetical protein
MYFFYFLGPKSNSCQHLLHCIGSLHHTTFLRTNLENIYKTDWSKIGCSTTGGGGGKDADSEDKKDGDEEEADHSSSRSSIAVQSEELIILGMASTCGARNTR